MDRSATDSCQTIQICPLLNLVFRILVDFWDVREINPQQIEHFELKSSIRLATDSCQTIQICPLLNLVFRILVDFWDVQEKND